MRKWEINIISGAIILLLLEGIGYGLVWMASFPSQTLLPSLGAEVGGAPPPPAARRRGPRGGNGGTGSIPSAPSGSGQDSASPPPPKQEKPSAPPPSCTCGSIEEKRTKKMMLLFGCVLTVFTFGNPVTIYWSLGSSLPDTVSFHSLWDLIATAAGCLAWLLFGITQLHTEGNTIFGVEAVVVNVIGVTVYTLLVVIKMAGDANINIKGCIGALVALCGPTFIVICFIVFGPVKRESSTATWISYGATLVQIFSQFLPFRSLVLGRREYRNSAMFSVKSFTQESNWLPMLHQLPPTHHRRKHLLPR